MIITAYLFSVAVSATAVPAPPNENPTFRLRAPGALVAQSDERPSPRYADPPVFGIGTAAGYGAGLATISSPQVGDAIAFSAGYSLPSLELLLFLPNGHSIELSLPVLDMLIRNLLNATFFGGMTFGGTLYYNLNVEMGTSGLWRMLIAPGVEGQVVAGSLSGGGVFGALMMGAEYRFSQWGARGGVRASMGYLEFAGVVNGRSLSASGVGGQIIGFVGMNLYPGARAGLTPPPDYVPPDEYMGPAYQPASEPPPPPPPAYETPAPPPPPEPDPSAPTHDATSVEDRANRLHDELDEAAPPPPEVEADPSEPDPNEVPPPP